MADTKKLTIEDHEKVNGIFITGKVDFSKKCTHEEFIKLSEIKGHIDLDYANRVTWLKHNGYEITRKNITANLASKK